MDRYVSVSEARRRFLQLVDETLEGDQIIVTKHGTPAVVLIDFEQLETLRGRDASRIGRSSGASHWTKN